MNDEVQELLNLMSERSVYREMLPLCPVGKAINRTRATMKRGPQEELRDFMNRMLSEVKEISREHECLQYNSCANCKRGQELFSEHLVETFGLWLGQDIETALKVLGAEGWSRRLPNFCEIGKQINTLTALMTDSGVDLRASITALESEYACTKTPSCIHCELGRGMFKQILLDLCENGMDGEWGKRLQNHYDYL